MKTVIAGGSGFLGRKLAAALVRASHDVTILTRSLPSGSVVRDPEADLPQVNRAGWLPDGSTGPWASLIDGADAVVNLAGASIGDGRWSAARKTLIRDSRIGPTRSLARAIAGAARPPSVLVSGSAVGYYGDRGDEALTEASAPGSDFLADLCVAWEREAASASSANTRLVLVRTGLVLDRSAGVLPRIALPFRFCVGGPVGPGRQFMSWIHAADWVSLVRTAIERDTLQGPMNATAPAPVRNGDFSRALGKALARPCWLPAPAVALRLALGEMAQALLLSSQRSLPTAAEASGFEFQHPELEAALLDIYSNGS